LTKGGRRIEMNSAQIYINGLELNPNLYLKNKVKLL